MSYRFDPELRPWIPMMPTIDITDLEAARRELAELVAQTTPAEPIGDLDVVDHTAPGPDGEPDVTVRVYTPRRPSGPLPGVLYVHGGGFVLGSVDQEDASARTLAEGAGVVVASVEYRLAPEHPYPAGLEDCYAALLWLAKNTAELGIDPLRLGITGVSAGGGLAAATTLLARDRNGPELRCQVLQVPELDDRLGTDSMTAYVDTPIWHRANAILSWQYYLSGREADGYAAPARADDLSGLPPAYLNVCQFDPLRDEGIAYAQRLAQAGVPTELHLYPGTFHGSALVADAAVSQRMLTDTIAAFTHLHD